MRQSTGSRLRRGISALRGTIHPIERSICCLPFILSTMAGGCYDFTEAAVSGCPQSPVIHHGTATYYYATGAGACSFDSSGDRMVAAMNSYDYDGSQICGASVSVTGPKGTVVVRIVDRCPGCGYGGIDLSREAFSEIADTSLGRVPVTWYILASDVAGPIIYHFNPASSRYWTAVQIRNNRYPVLSLEYVAGGKFREVTRETYNYFVQPNGMGEGPYIFRVTDIYGHMLTDSSVALRPGDDVPGGAQFPGCGN